MTGRGGDETLQDLLREKCRQWLIEDRWSLQEVEPNNETAWGFVAVDESGRRIVVGQRRDRIDMISISATVSVGEQHGRRLASMSPAAQARFLADLKLEMLRADYDFSGAELPLSQITIVQTCFFDGLSKDLFMDRVKSVRKGLLLIIVFLQSRLS